MTEYSIRPINPERDLPTLDERISRLPLWRRRDTLSYVYPIDRLQSALAWKLLENLLLRHCGISPYALRLDRTTLGKPFLRGYPGLHISLSHCPEAAMALVSDIPAACDIERIQNPDSQTEAVAELYYSPAERRLIAGSPDPALEFTKIWTVKEAVFKLDNSIDIERLDTSALPPSLSVCSTVEADFVATIARIRPAEMTS